MSKERRDPLILEIEGDDLPEAPDPSEAPPIEDRGAPGRSEDGEMPAGAAALSIAGSGRPANAGSGRTGGTIARIFWAGVLGLLTLAAGLAAEAFVSDLFSRAAALGWIAGAFLAAVLLGFAAFLLREFAGLARLGRVEGLNRRAAAGAAGDRAAAEAALSGLDQLYRLRGDAAEGLEALARARGDTPDPAERLGVAERLVLAPLDRQAERAVRRGARDVAAATAIIPLSALDVAMVLYVNLRMIRQVAEIYGGRAGWFGSWRLMRGVATHLIATGAVAVTEDLVAPLLGQSVLGQLSRRFGEAAVNAALTARVGVAAMEVCRPMPFAAQPSPRARTILANALSGWRKSKAAEPGGGR